MIARKQLAVAMLAAGLVLAAGFLGYSFARNFALNALRVEARYRLDLLSGAIDAEVSRLSNIPGVVAVNSNVLDLLRAPGASAQDLEASVNRFLAQVSAQHVDSLAIFVMDTAGRVVASSDSIYTNNLLHADLSHLQFFRSAIVGAPSRQYTVDAVHDEAGHFFALPIRDELQDWRIVGVAVVKASMRGIERRWLVSNEPALIAGDDGVVLQAWPRDWRFATLGKISEEEMRELALQRYLGREAGGVAFSPDLATPEEGVLITLPDHVDLPERMAVKGREFFVVSRKQIGAPWSLVVFQNVRSMRVLAIGGGALAAAMMLSAILGGLYLWQRHRAMAARLVAQLRLEVANRKLEATVRKRTEQLTHTVDKLKEEVSQRERAEAFLRSSEQRFRALFEFSPDPCWFIEGKRFVSCNFAAVDILGYETRADLLAVHPTQISPEFQPDGRVSVEKALEMIKLAYDKGVLRFEWEYRRRDGSSLPVEVTLTRIAIFGPGILYCMWRDISERKAAECALLSANRRYETLNAELEERVVDRTRLLEAEIQERRAAEAAVVNSERWLREIIDTIPSGILLWNGEQRLVAWNHSFEQMFPTLMRDMRSGFFCAELQSLLERCDVVGLLDTTTDDWNHCGRWECALADGRVFAVERLATSDGGRLMQIADITVQVRTADALARNERMASLGRLVAGIAHEINTPIGNALMVSSSIDDRVRDLQSMLAAGTLRRSVIDIGLEEIAEAADLTVRNLIRAGQLIQNFKQVAVDQTSEQRRKFQLSSVLDDLRQTLMHRLRHASCDFALHVGDGICMDSYPGAVGQIVTNLVENSLLHAFDGCAEGRLKIVARQLGETVEILFSDNGNGIHRDVLPRIFDPFFTTKMGQGGTGLGLSIMINLVRDLLGGDVKVDSQVGRGTDFHILLPLHAPVND